MQVRKQWLDLDMEPWTSSKLGKEDIKAVYCHLVYLIYIESTSCEMPDWIKHKMESRLPGEISITSDMTMMPPSWQKTKRNLRAFWGKWKRRVKKTDLKLNIQKNQDHGIWFHHFMANRWGKIGTSDRLYFLGPQNHCRWWLQPWN